MKSLIPLADPRHEVDPRLRPCRLDRNQSIVADSNRKSWARLVLERERDDQVPSGLSAVMAAPEIFAKARSAVGNGCNAPHLVEINRS
jgi:hypothetical protein